MADGNPIPVRFLRVGQKQGIPILLRKAGKFLFRILQQAGKNLLILSAVQIILYNIQDKAYFFIFSLNASSYGFSLALLQCAAFIPLPDLLPGLSEIRGMLPLALAPPSVSISL